MPVQVSIASPAGGAIFHRNDDMTVTGNVTPTDSTMSSWIEDSGGVVGSPGTPVTPPTGRDWAFLYTLDSAYPLGNLTVKVKGEHPKEGMDTKSVGITLQA